MNEKAPKKPPKALKRPDVVLVIHAPMQVRYEAFCRREFKIRHLTDTITRTSIVQIKRRRWWERLLPF